MSHEDYDHKGPDANVDLWREPQEAWYRDEVIAGKPSVVMERRL
jgi:hypothetical protein